MQDLSATCPLCETTSQYGAELIGRYTLCPACRGRFYIEVPPLGKPKTPDKLWLAISPLTASASLSTLDDLLWDTPRGNRFVTQSLCRIESRLRWQGYFMGLTLLLMIIAILVWR